jgi:TetR/AcrR family transcriptional regulator of autoinduction and epiphytic fitness
MNRNTGIVKKLTEIKREQIIQAAKDEFRDNGFAATSMDRIAKAAQVSKRTVYNHFESKEILFGVIAKELCTAFSSASDFPYEPNEPIRRQLEAIVNRQMEMLCSERFLRAFKLMTAETLNSPELTKPVFDEFQETDIGVIKWITAASKDGKLSVENPVFAGKQFFALLEVFTTWPYLWGIEHSGEEFKPEYVKKSAVDMFLDHYEVRS